MFTPENIGFKQIPNENDMFELSGIVAIIGGNTVGVTYQIVVDYKVRQFKLYGGTSKGFLGRYNLDDAKIIYTMIRYLSVDENPEHTAIILHLQKYTREAKINKLLQ